MKKTSALILTGVLIAGLTLTGCKTDGKIKFNNDLEKVSYAIGQSIGANIKMQNLGLNVKSLKKGLDDGLVGKSGLTPEEMQKVLMEFQQNLQEKRMKELKVQSEKNLKDGIAFLAKKKTEKDVIATPSGLEYKVIKSGTGTVSPKADDTVVVHYVGKLIDGKEFDSSIARKQPATFKANQVIPGWTEMLQLMKVGDKVEVYIPSKLAYGENGAGPVIGPNAVLVFEIELIDINPKPTETEKK